MVNVPVILALQKWLREQTTDVSIFSNVERSCHITDQGRWLGEVSLIYPEPDKKTSLQYDYYLAKDYPGRGSRPQHAGEGHYCRSIWQITDPNSFTGVLKTALALKYGHQIAWHETYRFDNGMLVLEKRNA